MRERWGMFEAQIGQFGGRGGKARLYRGRNLRKSNGEIIGLSMGIETHHISMLKLIKKEKNHIKGLATRQGDFYREKEGMVEIISITTRSYSPPEIQQQSDMDGRCYNVRIEGDSWVKDPAIPATIHDPNLGE
ncbi:hypothetical protein DH2020_041430 [Rehmannia glutinosa]|uniref:Uncharacterized protein n=1 Tax=Rehmannia glutinosa TaxID=99300 RepID=A0ABR0URB8_REHGL